MRHSPSLGICTWRERDEGEAQYIFHCVPSHSPSLGICKWRERDEGGREMKEGSYSIYVKGRRGISYSMCPRCNEAFSLIRNM